MIQSQQDNNFIVWREVDQLTSQPLHCIRYKDQETFEAKLEKYLHLEYILDGKQQVQHYLTTLERIDEDNRTLYFNDTFFTLKDLINLRKTSNINWLDNPNDLFFLIVKLGNAILALSESNIYHDDIQPDLIVLKRSDCFFHYDLQLIQLESLSYGFANQQFFTPFYSPVAAAAIMNE